jgi:hypothetical protein
VNGICPANVYKWIALLIGFLKGAIMKQSRWALWFVCLGVAVSTMPGGKGSDIRAEDVKVTRPDLTGVVQSSDGKPLAQASVFIYTAGPKFGCVPPATPTAVNAQLPTRRGVLKLKASTLTCSFASWLWPRENDPNS